MPLCANGYGTCSCFASGCGYIGTDNVVHGCESMCCNGQCPGQSYSGSKLSTNRDPDAIKYMWVAFALLVLLGVISTISLI